MVDDVAIAMGIALGMTDAQIAQLAGASLRTVSRRRKDPEILARADEFVRGRVAGILRVLEDNLRSNQEVDRKARETLIDLMCSAHEPTVRLAAVHEANRVHFEQFRVAGQIASSQALAHEAAQLRGQLQASDGETVDVEATQVMVEIASMSEPGNVAGAEG
jgi:hypothetical protein